MLRHHFQRLNPAGWFSLCIISVMGTIGLSALMLLPLLVGTYIDHLGFAEDTAGWIASINLAGVTLMTLVVSLKTRHWSLARVAAIGLASMIVFDLLSILSPSLYTFSVLRFLSGMAGGAVQAVVAAAIARLARSDKGYGIYIGFQFLLPALAFYILPGILPDLGFAGLMQFLIGLEVLLLLFVPVLSNYRLRASTGDSLPGPAQAEWRLTLQPAAFLSLVGLCIYGAANASIYAYAERIGLNAGLSWQQTGNVLSVANVLAVFGALLVVWLQDRYGHLKPLGVGIACQVLAMLMLLYSPTITGYWLAIIVWSIAWAFTWPYFLSMQADLDSSGTIVVAGQFTNLLGNSAGPAIAAYLLTGGAYNQVIWLTSILFLLSLLPMYFVNRHLPAKAPGRLLETWPE